MRVVPAGEGQFQLRSLAGGVYLPTLLYGTGQWMILPIIPLFAKDLGAGVAIIGAIVAAHGAGTMLGDVPSGLLAGRLGGRATMIAGGVISAVSAAAMGLSTGSAVLAAFVLVNGAAFALWDVSRLAYVTEAAPTAYRGRALSLVGGTTRVGAFIGPIAGGALGQVAGLEAVFFAQAGVVAAAAFVVAMRIRQPRAGGSAAAARLSLGSVVRAERRSLLVAGSVAIALVIIRNGRQILIPLWGESIGLDVARIGLIFGLSSAVDMVLFYPVGMVMDRWGRKWTFVPSLATLSASLILMPFTGGFASFLAVSLLSGFGNGLGSGAVMTLGADLAPPDAAGEFLGVWRLVGDAGAAVAPAAVGGLAAALTLGASAVVTGGVGLAGAAMMLLLVRETLRRSSTDARPPSG